MPTWFLLLLAFCGGWVANTVLQIFSGKAVYVAGRQASRSVTAVVWSPPEAPHSVENLDDRPEKLIRIEQKD